MKFIGQFIQNFIARFRSDVYLENIADGTVANDKFLGLDSNNKIVKEAISSSTTDLTSDVTGTLPLGNGGTGQTSAQTAINALAGGTTNGRYLQGDGDNIVLATIDSADVPTLNQNTTGSSASCTGNAATATKLATQRDLQCDLGETGADGFDGSANATAIGVTGTLGVNNGGTGLTSISTLLNSNVTTISGNAGTATNLVASTSTAVQLGTVELGHADDTTLSRSASGTLAVEGKKVRTEDKTIMIKQGSFASGSSGFATSSVVFFPMTGTAENTSANGTAQPFLAPVNGKLLKLHLRSNKDHSPSSETQVFTLRNWDDDEQFTDGNKTILAQKTVTGVTKSAPITIDFTTGLDSTANADTNEFTAGETLCIGMQNGFDTNATTKYYFTAVFEFDFSSY